MKNNNYNTLLYKRMSKSLVQAEMRFQAFFFAVIPITTMIGIFADIPLLLHLPPAISFVVFIVYAFPKQYYDGTEGLTSMLAFNYSFVSPTKRLLLQALICLCGGFTMLSYIVFISYGGNPVIVNGAFWINSHGQLIRAISEYEYKVLKIFSMFDVTVFYIFTVCSYYSSKNDFLDHRFTTR